MNNLTENFWETRYRQNIGKMTGICYRYVASRQVAEDLAHDAEEEIQELTNKHTKTVDDVVSEKEVDIKLLLAWKNKSTVYSTLLSTIAVLIITEIVKGHL